MSGVEEFCGCSVDVVAGSTEAHSARHVLEPLWGLGPASQVIGAPFSQLRYRGQTSHGALQSFLHRAYSGATPRRPEPAVRHLVTSPVLPDYRAVGMFFGLEMDRGVAGSPAGAVPSVRPWALQVPPPRSVLHFRPPEAVLGWLLVQCLCVCGWRGGALCWRAPEVLRDLSWHYPHRSDQWGFSWRVPWGWGQLIRRRRADSDRCPTLRCGVYWYTSVWYTSGRPSLWGPPALGHCVLWWYRPQIWHTGGTPRRWGPLALWRGVLWW